MVLIFIISHFIHNFFNVIFSGPRRTKGNNLWFYSRSFKSVGGNLFFSTSTFLLATSYCSNPIRIHVCVCVFVWIWFKLELKMEVNRVECWIVCENYFILTFSYLGEMNTKGEWFLSIFAMLLCDSPVFGSPFKWLNACNWCTIRVFVLNRDSNAYKFTISQRII